jgi:putative ABC transport system permease protein
MDGSSAHSEAASMRSADVGRFAWQALSRHRFRTAMVLLAMAVGVAAVVVLTALGEGARQFVLAEFEALGSDVLIIFPGRKETTGGMPPAFGTAARDLTLDDARHLAQRLPAVERWAPLVLGSAEVSHAGRSREVMTLGTTGDFIELRRLRLAQGRNMGDGRGECLIGQTLKAELFGYQAAIGRRIRVGDYRCRVVGVLAGRGDAMGMDLSDVAVMPVAAAQRLFNVPGLFRLMVRIRPGQDLDAIRARIEAVIKDRHRGDADVTVVSPDAMLATFDGILLALTLGVAAIGGISLLVAGVLIMNVTLIGISQRRAEIGLLKALGASSREVQALFLAEAVMSALTGALLGLLGGYLLSLAGAWLLPSIPFATPVWAAIAAVLVATGTGLAFAWLPARRASRMAPVEALQQR